MNTTAELPSNNRRRLFRTIMMLVAVVGTLWPYMFSLAGGTDTTFSLNNRTRYYLHANINNQTFVYIAPGGTVVVDIKAPASVYAKVRYSPGQNIQGVGERTVDVQTTTTSTEGSSTCNSDNQESTCNTTNPTSTTTANPARWEVLPTDLKPE